VTLNTLQGVVVQGLPRSDDRLRTTLDGTENDGDSPQNPTQSKLLTSPEFESPPRHQPFLPRTEPLREIAALMPSNIATAA
jgi:hypothetical protein